MLVPDDRGVFFGLSVREHFRLAHRRPDRERERQVLERFPALRDLQGRRVGLLSGGEQQMLTIAKAILAKPKVLMIDEMSLGLAPKIVQEMLPSIRDLAKEEDRPGPRRAAHRARPLGRGPRDHPQPQPGRAGRPAKSLLNRRADVEAAYFGADEYGDADAVLPS